MGSTLFKLVKELIIKNIFRSSNETGDAFEESVFINIPNEVILHIFRFLSVHDLSRIASKQLHSKSYRKIYME